MAPSRNQDQSPEASQDGRARARRTSASKPAHRTTQRSSEQRARDKGTPSGQPQRQRKPQAQGERTSDAPRQRKPQAQGGNDRRQRQRKQQPQGNGTGTPRRRAPQDQLDRASDAPRQRAQRPQAQDGMAAPRRAPQQRRRHPSDQGPQQRKRRSNAPTQRRGNARRRPPANESARRGRPPRKRPASSQRKPQTTSLRQRVLPLVIVGGIALFIVGLIVFGITRCTAKDSQKPQQAATQQAAASTNAASSSASSNKEKSSEDSSASSSKSSSSSASSSSSSAPSSEWKKAAGVDELTSDGTDPTAIAAEMEAERIAKNKKNGYEGVDDPWLKSGTFTTGDEELDELVKAFCDKHTTKGASATENAYNTFCNITWSDYNEWEGNQHPHTYDWTVDYAKDFFNKGGNCFSMAAAIQWCLRYYGYSDAHAELTYQLRQSGLSLDHGLNWVTDLESGEIRLVDSEMAANGWMMSPGAYTVEILDPTGNWEPRSSAFDRSEMA